MNIIGIDLGATKIRLAKYDSSNWRKLDGTQFPTKTDQGAEAVIGQLADLIIHYRDKQTQAVGIGVPGPTLHGIVQEFPNIPGLKNFDLKSKIEDLLKTASYKLKINIENDASCFTTGAWQSGKHRDKHNIVGLTLGTGVGGGIILDGHLIRGKNGAAGEFGHEIIRDDKELEDLVSGTALSKRWQEKFKEPKTGQEILELAMSGNEDAKNFLRSVGQDLGSAIANIILQYNPEIIFIGGSASAPLPFYQKSIAEKIAEHCFPESRKTTIELVKNQDCATFGAAWLAKNGP